MNISNVSVYDNLENLSNECSSSEGGDIIQIIIKDVLTALANFGTVCYCPFCVSTFSDISLLTDHLQLLHSSFLWELTVRSINFINCPFCAAKFLGNHLLAKHTLSYHGNILIDTYFKKNNGPDCCFFCNIIILREGIPTHIEQSHLLEFDEWVASQFSLQSGGTAGLINGLNSKKQADINDLNIQLENLSVDLTPKSILKNSIKTKTRGRQKLPVRRVLSFEDDKENIGSTRTLRPKAETSGKNRRSFCSLSSGPLAFKCGKCDKSFSNNPQLVIHLKKEHRKLSHILQPLHKCGICGARFYQNAYLKKHSSIHSLTKMR